MQASQRSALIVVDVQNDYCTGGSMAVNGSERVIQRINTLRTESERETLFDCIILTKDFHPAQHVSFAVNHPGEQVFTTIRLANGTSQELWPVHCVIDTPGAEFHADLLVRESDKIVCKGQHIDIDSYSGFGSAGEQTGLPEYLNQNRIEKLFVCGLSYDFCVGSTALDAAKLGFNTVIVTDASAHISEVTQARMNERIAEFSDRIQLLTTQEIIQLDRRQSNQISPNHSEPENTLQNE